MSLIIPANSASAAGGYAVDNSCRFNSGDNCKISRTSPNSSPTNAKKFTISFWVKRSNIDAGSGHEHQQIFDSNDGSAGPNIQFQMYFTGNTLRLQTHNGSNKMELVTNRLFRDISAWYSIIFSYDSTPSTPSASSVRLWINGVLETSFSTAVYPSQNTDGEFAIQNDIQMIGNNTANTRDLGGYLAEVIGVDGQALVNTDFGEFDEDSGIFKPIDVSGIDVGTLGFYLDFEDSSALGNDVSGVGDFTLANLAAIDQSTDTCTNNFATLNPLAPMDTSASVQTLSEGNLKAVPSSGWNPVYATIPLSLGKWYIEVLVTQVSGNEVVIGLNPDNFSNTSDTAHSNSGSGVWYQSNGLKWISGSSSSYGATYDDGDIISVLINMDDSEVTFYKNDASQGTISFNTNLTAASSIIFGLNGIETTSITQTNFGSPPYAISSGNQDGDGFGNFEFATKGGYALNTKNLAEYG